MMGENKQDRGMLPSVWGSGMRARFGDGERVDP